MGALINNMATIEVFEEDFRLRNGRYEDGVWNGGADADLISLGWRPQADDGVVYTISRQRSDQLHRDGNRYGWDHSLPSLPGKN